MRELEDGSSASKFTLPSGGIHNRAQSTEKKGGQSFAMDPSLTASMTTKNMQRRATVANPKGIGSQGLDSNQQISDVESRFSRARPSIAGGTEDGGQFTSRIPREIRTDPDVEAKLGELD